MDWSLGNYWFLLLLLLLPIVGVFLGSYIQWKNKKKELFAEHRFQDVLFEKSTWFTKLFPILYLLAFLFLILSIVDILGGKQEIKVNQNVNNVMFVLDVSNSMNAQDVNPSRLEQAKNIVINSLHQLKNDKVGIVVFAGESFSIMPLTTDYSAAENYLQGIETSVVQKQGTDFLKAIEVASQKFKNISKGSRNIVLISDGEDNEENEKAAIKLSKSEGIRVISVAIGTEDGAPIPDYYFGQLMGYKTDLYGETVVSKLQSKTLKNISSSTDGSYIDGNNLDSAINKLTEELQKSSSSNSTMVDSFASVRYYQYLLVVSLFLFILIYCLNPKQDFNV